MSVVCTDVALAPDLPNLLCVAHDASPIPFVLYGEQAGGALEVRYENAAAAALCGGGQPSLAQRATQSGSPLLARLRHVLATGTPYRGEERHEQEPHPYWLRIAASRPAPGYVSVWLEDITEAREVAEREREDARTNEILLRVSSSISGLDLAAIVQSVTDEATRICRAEFGAFFYNQQSTRDERYVLFTVSGVSREAFAQFPMPRNTALFTPTFRGERVVRHGDVTLCPEYGQSAPFHGMPPGHLPVRSYLAVPVVSRTGQVLGGLFFGHSAADVFTERDERTVAAIAQQAAVAMDNARLFDLAQKERALAEDASRMKDDFLATISHELRTPLQSILGWTHMLRTGSLAETSRQRALEAVDRNARAQAALIDDILDVSRIISGKLRIDVAAVQMAEVVQAALETVRPAADAREVALAPVLDRNAGIVMGDANRLHQVVWNLLSNAVKFSDRGGRVSVHLRRANGSLEVVVSDQGQGIEPEFLPHVFERFRQADSSTTRNTGGLGLGLSIVKHLVELHGGSVSAHSEGVGKGATFTLRVPVAPVRAVAAESWEAKSPMGRELDLAHRLEGLHILVVDDEEDARELLRSILEHCRAIVRSAGSVREALALVTEERPDVLVTDIGMPGEDGYVLIERLRALPPDAGGRTPAVALTAYARAEDRTRALARGFNHYVAKPVDPGELLVVIANLAERFG